MNQYYQSGQVFEDWEMVKASTPFTRPVNHIQPHFVFRSKQRVRGVYRLRSVLESDKREALLRLTPPKADDTICLD